MKKVGHKILSNKDCVTCGKGLKQNLINKRPDANECWSCWYPKETKRKGGHGSGRMIKNF